MPPMGCLNVCTFNIIIVYVHAMCVREHGTCMLYTCVYVNIVYVHTVCVHLHMMTASAPEETHQHQLCAQDMY